MAKSRRIHAFFLDLSGDKQVTTPYTVDSYVLLRSLTSGYFLSILLCPNINEDTDSIPKVKSFIPVLLPATHYTKDASDYYTGHLGQSPARHPAR